MDQRGILDEGEAAELNASGWIKREAIAYRSTYSEGEENFCNWLNYQEKRHYRRREARQA